MNSSVDAVVDVIIPTIGRASLVKAVDSVLTQTVPSRAIVVLDIPSESDSVRSLLKGRNYTLLLTTGAERGAAARNLGLDHSTAKWIAFLDDDDWWGPSRMADLLKAVDVAGANSSVLVGAPFHFVLPDGSSRVVPTVAPQADRGHASMANYLIRRSALRFGENAMQTSTLLISSRLALATRWAPGLRKHQDWDFIVRLLNTPGAAFVWAENSDCFVQKDSPGSISKQMDWKASLLWIESVDNGSLDRRSRSDFLWTHVLRSALAQKSASGIWSFLLSKPWWPHFASIVVGVSGFAQILRRRR